MGLAAALLVFTGIWHLTEVFMDRTAKDARKLIPFGAVYTGLGVAMAMGFAGWIVSSITVLAVLTGMTLAFVNRKAMDIRNRVLWSFIVIDALIVLAIVAHWI